MSCFSPRLWAVTMFWSLGRAKIAVEFATGKEIRVYWKKRLTQKITEDMVSLCLLPENALS